MHRVPVCGTTGADDRSLHHAPRQWLGERGVARGSVSQTARPRSKRSACSNDGSNARLCRDVTRWEQPARAWLGASAIQTRNGSAAPAPARAHVIECENLVIAGTARSASSTVSRCHLEDRRNRDNARAPVLAISGWWIGDQLPARNVTTREIPVTNRRTSTRFRNTEKLAPTSRRKDDSAREHHVSGWTAGVVIKSIRLADALAAIACAAG